MEPVRLLQAAGRGLLGRQRMGIRRFHQSRQASQLQRRGADPYSQRMLRLLHRVGRGFLARLSIAGTFAAGSSRLQVVPAARGSVLRRRRLVPIGYRPPRTEAERAARLHTLQSQIFAHRVRLVQRWWRNILLRRNDDHHQLVLARLAVINAMAVLIQRWWRSLLLQIRFVPPSATELREASLAIVAVQDLRVQRGARREQLLKRWHAVLSHDKAPRVGRVRPWKRGPPTRVVLNPIPVSGRYVSNLSAAHASGRSEWNDSAALTHKLWYCEPKEKLCAHVQ
jgi:hypothetical protein